MNFWSSKVSNINLRKRSWILHNIRNFFFKRKILEVETPSLTQYTITDINLSALKLYTKDQYLKQFTNLWLVTSPEYYMKRLLASGIGPIYQISHVFRNDKLGRYHSFEFTMLEWYQPFYNMFDMIDIIKRFFYDIFFIYSLDTISYRNMFMKYLCIDPFYTNKHQLHNLLKSFNHTHLIHSKNTILEILELIFIINIQPNLGRNKPVIVYHYPANQAMLSRINNKNRSVSDRFEIFFKGIELGNGFYELINSSEQKKRFEKDNFNRIKLGLSVQKIDYSLLYALNSIKMPYCSGVAIGLDRCIMIALNMNQIHNVISFSLF